MNTGSLSKISDAPPVLILAAGSASRFGEDKRRVPVNLQKTLLEKSISQYLDLGLRVLVSLSERSDDDSLEALLDDLDVECLRCSRAGEGMGGTLAQSVAAITNAKGVMIALGDMPAIQSATILRLLAVAGDQHIVYPVFEGVRGHPVFFGSHFMPLLKTAAGDRGASSLIRNNADCCIPVTVDDPGVLWDVDTPSDLQRIQALLYARSSGGASL